MKTRIENEKLFYGPCVMTATGGATQIVTADLLVIDAAHEVNGRERGRAVRRARLVAGGAPDAATMSDTAYWRAIRAWMEQRMGLPAQATLRAPKLMEVPGGVAPSMTFDAD